MLTNDDLTDIIWNLLHELYNAPSYTLQRMVDDEDERLALNRLRLDELVVLDAEIGQWRLTDEGVIEAADIEIGELAFAEMEACA